MPVPFRGLINIDIKDSVPDWEPFRQPVAPDGTPSVLYVVLDDVGFPAWNRMAGSSRPRTCNRIAERLLT